MKAISAKAREPSPLVKEHPHVRHELAESAHREPRSWQVIALFSFSFGRIVYKVIQWIIGVSMDMLYAKLVTRQDRCQRLSGSPQELEAVRELSRPNLTIGLSLSELGVRTKRRRDTIIDRNPPHHTPEQSLPFSRI